MPSTSLYTLVASASLLLALWQPADAETWTAGQPETRAPSSEQAEGVSQKLDERVARHKERWEQRKAKSKLAGATP